MIVHYVVHRRPRGGHVGWPLANEKLIGFFSTPELADGAIEATRPLPGFSDWPDGFTIEAIVVDDLRFPEGFDVKADRRLIPEN